MPLGTRDAENPTLNTFHRLLVPHTHKSRYRHRLSLLIWAAKFNPSVWRRLKGYEELYFVDQS